MENRLAFILRQMEKENQFKRDEVLDFSTLRMNPNATLSTVDNRLSDYRMTEWATNQLCQRLNIPFNFYADECDNEMREFNVNKQMQKIQEHDLMLRLRENGDEKFIRAIVSKKYSKFDNHEILNLVKEYLDASKMDYEIAMWHYDGDGFHLRITFNHLTTQIGTTPDGQEDIHKVGIHIMNSEVGKSAVRIIPMVYRLVCTNGLMSWTTDGEIFSQRHLFISHETMQERVAVAIGEALKLGEHTMEILEKAKQYQVDNPIKMIENLAKEKKYTKKFTEKVKQAYNEENDGSLFYVVQAFTEASKSLKEEERVEKERHAASLLQVLTEAA